MCPGTPADSSEQHVRTTINTAWTYTFCRTWTKAKLISLSRIQRHIMRATHVPVTLEMLLHGQSEHTKHQRRSWWSHVESVFRCVADYDHAFVASEHDSCRCIQNDICAYAHTLRRGLPSSVDVTQFLMLLHRSIINRALNLALRKTIDQSFRPWTDDLLVGPGGERMTDQAKQALSDLLEQCLETVEHDYQRFRTDMRQFRS